MGDGKGYLLPDDPLPDALDDDCVRVFYPNAPRYRQALSGQLSDLGKWFLWEKEPDHRAVQVAARWKDALVRTYASWDADEACGGGIEPGANVIDGYTYNFRADDYDPRWQPGSGDYDGCTWEFPFGWHPDIQTDPLERTYRAGLLVADYEVPRYLKQLKATFLVSIPPQQQAYSPRAAVLARNVSTGVEFRYELQFAQLHFTEAAEHTTVLYHTAMTYSARTNWFDRLSIEFRITLADDDPTHASAKNVWLQELLVQSWSDESPDW